MRRGPLAGGAHKRLQQACVWLATWKIYCLSSDRPVRLPNCPILCTYRAVIDYTGMRNCMLCLFPLSLRVCRYYFCRRLHPTHGLSYSLVLLLLRPSMPLKKLLHLRSKNVLKLFKPSGPNHQYPTTLRLG
jgi:hypothetical protein